MSGANVLVAGIGNVFLGDDGFGVEVVRRLAGRSLPEGVTVRDFGIRGLDLAYALADYDVAILVDVVPRDGEPGTLFVIDAAEAAEGPVGVDTHGMDPAKVLAFARNVGPMPEEIYVVGCQPGFVPEPDAEELVVELSDAAEAAVEGAIEEVERLALRAIGRERDPTEAEA